MCLEQCVLELTMFSHYNMCCGLHVIVYLGVGVVTSAVSRPTSHQHDHIHCFL